LAPASASNSADQEHNPPGDALGGSALQAFETAHEKGPLSVESVQRAKISAREVERCRHLLQGAQAKAQELAARRSLSGLGCGRLIRLVLRLEDDPFVEFRKGELDLDLRQGENRVGDQDFVCPRLA
jgi:hypothetical protein